MISNEPEKMLTQLSSEELEEGPTTSHEQVLEQKERRAESTINGGATVLLKEGVTKYYRRLRAVEPDTISKFRDVEINVQSFGFQADVPSSAEIETVHKNKYMKAVRNNKSETLNVLKDVNLSFKSGTISLVLGSPGSGKSSLLKALGGSLSSNTTGKVLYNGLPVSEVDRLRTVALIDQTDNNHIPVLTVRETLDFANACQNGVSSRSSGEDYEKISKRNVDVILRLLGLDVCADTIVGNEKIRGISGGQRRRVTTGELLVSGVSVLLGDEISTGLDSSATFDIVSSLKSWAKAMNGTVVLVLLQPQPEVVALFDQIVLMDEGQVICAGTLEETESHFQNLGFYCPPRKDFADFLQEVTSKEGLKFFDKPGSSPPSTVDDFHSAFQNSPVFQAMKATVDKTVEETEDCALRSADAVRLLAPDSNKERFANSFFQSLVLLIKREWMLTTRDHDMLKSLFGEALIVGLLMGGIFFAAANVANYSVPRPGVGGLFFCCAILQRQAWQQIPILMRVRATFYKQRRRDFFQTSAFVAAFTLVQIPLNIMAMVVFCPIVYFMIGYEPTGNNFMFFFLTIVLLQHALRSIFLCIGAATRTASSAQYSAAIFVVAFLLFSGYIIANNLIPVWWIWVYYINPIAYALRSLMINEYDSAKYDGTQSAFVLETYGIYNQQSTMWMWAGPILLSGYFLFFNFLTTIVLHYVRYDAVTPKAVIEKRETQISDVEENVAPSSLETEAAFEVRNHTFVPVTLAFRNICYTVYPRNVGKDGLQLLTNVSGVFRPGVMTALMGSSGAGKTTLMDVIAGKKNQGKILGDITINGNTARPSDFSKISGYCEQMDIHSPEASVYEAFFFSASLRQPQEVPVEDKVRFVNNVIALLQLEDVRDRLIGESPADGLSVSQRKLVTIGVELCANPAVLFADEPTSGLDARGATIVMQALRKIAEANRTVVCTIHQPSVYIFEMFDSLLLLQKGGTPIFNGKLGTESCHLIEYFQSNGARQILPGENPANYMLNVIGAGVDKAVATPEPEEQPADDMTINKNKVDALFEEPEESGSSGSSSGSSEEEEAKTGKIDFGAVYLSSQLKKDMASEVEKEIGKSDSDSSLLKFPNDRARATTILHQFKHVAHKAFQTYWRSPQYNFKRIGTLVMLALLFGTAYLLTGPMFPINTTAKARSFAALIYLCMDFIAILLMVTVLPITFRERSVYYRERASQYYSSWVYMSALFLVELPYLIISVALFCVIMYFLIGLSPVWFGYFFVVFWLYVSLCTYIGQLFAIITPNEVIGQIMVGFTTVVFNLASGYLISRPNINVALRWIYWAVPSSYAFNGLASTQLAYCPYPDAPYQGCNILVDRNQTLSEYAMDTFALNFNHIYEVDIPALIGFWVFTLAACALGLKYINHDPR